VLQGRAGVKTLSEQDRSTKSRSYRMTRRAEGVAETRQRIVEATVELHGMVGPAGSTIAGIAERAGVTRLTVYRHFPTEEALYAACSAHWLARQDPPDPARWTHLTDPSDRLRAALTDLYRFYRAGAAMLGNVLRDFDAMPASFRQAQEEGDAALRSLLAAPLPTSDRTLLDALVKHATSFWTWRSLCVDGGLTNTTAVDAMTALVLTAVER
jgi:AcrR family transcriptional regulator